MRASVAEPQRFACNLSFPCRGSPRWLAVWCRNSIASKSSRIPIVVVQDTAEPLAPSDGAFTGACICRQSFDELVSESLVIPLTMVVLDVLREHVAQVPLAEGNHTSQALGPRRSHEPLRVGIEVRPACRKSHHVDTRGLEDLAEASRVERVAVEDGVASPGWLVMPAICTRRVPMSTTNGKPAGCGSPSRQASGRGTGSRGSSVPGDERQPGGDGKFLGSGEAGLHHADAA